MKRKSGLYVCLIILTVVVGALWMHALNSVSAQDHSDYAVTEYQGDRFLSNSVSVFPNCRVGAAIWHPYWGSPDLSLFNFGVFIDFTARNQSPGPDSMEYWQMVRFRQDRGPNGEYLDSYTLTNLDWTSLEARVKANPGVLWIVGNEPDRVVLQDDTYPAMYARIYHDVYHFIKDIDTTARVAVAGLVGFTPGREQYMDIVWDTYLASFGVPMPVDAWTIHPYVLWESGGGGAHVALGTDPSLAIPYSPKCADPNAICYAEHDDINLFAAQIVRMREWMWRHGQQAKPLLATEWSILLPYEWGDGSYFYDENGETFNPDRVSQYMRLTQDYFRNTRNTRIGYPADDYRLVQQWLWFPFSWQSVEASASNLVEAQSPYQSTLVGQAWQQYVQSWQPEVNLAVEAHSTVVFSPIDEVEISVRLYNRGNTYTHSPVTVTFYSDIDLTQSFSTVSLPPQPGCLWGKPITTTWNQAWSPGAYPFWVEVDGGIETDLSDNIAQGWVFIDPEQVFLPLVARKK